MAWPAFTVLLGTGERAHRPLGVEELRRVIREITLAESMAMTVKEGK